MPYCKEYTFIISSSLLYLICQPSIYAQGSSVSRSFQPPVECRGAPAINNENDLTNLPSSINTVRITSPLEISESINISVDLCFMRNGRLDINDGVSVYSDGEIYAGAWKIFDYKGEMSNLVAPNIPVIFPEWWGAQADDNINDSTALRQAGNFLSEVGGGRIDFSHGTYIVGQQYQSTGNLFPLQHQPILEVYGTDDLVEINGNGARLIAEDGLFFGYFDPITGAPAVPSICGAHSSYAANAYTMINLEFNQNVIVRDFELDGNIFGLELGEECPDGRQLYGYGIRAYNNNQVLIENIHAHHNALDGLVIGYAGLTDGETTKPHILRNIVSEYNARQGISWVGGNSLLLDGCKLNHTGKARFSSPPGAGIDIEAEEAVIRNGMITNCEFINNFGPGVVSASGDGGYTTVKNSTIWGTTHWALVSRKPGMVFEDSFIYGSVPNPYGSDDPELATRFTRCLFEDLDYGNLGVYRSTGALLELEGHNVIVEDSEIIANHMRAIWLDGQTTREIMRNVSVTHGDSNRSQNDFHSLFRGSYLENLHFKEAFSATSNSFSDKGWHIIVESNVTYTNVCVDGPSIKWSHSSGSIGCPVP